MDVHDVIRRGTKETIQKILFECMAEGERISKIEGLSKGDERILKSNYQNGFYDRIHDLIKYSLENHIPAFDRLCNICEGTLDCTCDHK